MRVFFCVVALLVGCFCEARAATVGADPQQAALAAAVDSKDWAAVHNILAEIHRSKFNWLQKNYMPEALSPLGALPSVDVKDLKPGPDSQVYGKAVSTYISSLDRDGRREVQSGGHEVENVNGNVTERDFDPLARRAQTTG